MDNTHACLGMGGGVLDWCMGCIPAERAHQAWVLPVVSAPFHATTPSEGGAGYYGSWYPPLCWLGGGYWVWAVRAAAWSTFLSKTRAKDATYISSSIRIATFACHEVWNLYPEVIPLSHSDYSHFISVPIYCPSTYIHSAHEFSCTGYASNRYTCTGGLRFSILAHIRKPTVCNGRAELGFSIELS